MKRRGFLKGALASAAQLSANPLLLGAPAATGTVKCGDLEATLGADGIPLRIESGLPGSRRMWLDTSPNVSVRSEVTNVSDSPASGEIKALGLRFGSKWSSSRFGLVWDLTFEGTGKRVGHEVTIDLPALSPGLKIFTPSNDPEFQVSARPTYRPVAYATEAWKTGGAYVLPLITLLDPKTDQALTVALPPNVNIPHLQFEWIAGRVVRLTLGHRGMGEGKAIALAAVVLFSSGRLSRRDQGL